ncbi:MAG TPA: peptidyl-prolyl cis-trans isomerase [Caulobacteraceae bacterium]|nr:peptidyl-prolyl cis-trans isomerase [Caulobacteraceae bacterium]
MLAAIRKFAKSPVAVVLLGLLIVSFAIWGINDVFNYRGGNTVISAGDREVTQPEFKRIFDNFKKGQEERSGQRVTMEEIVQRGFHLQFLRELTDQTAFAEWARKAWVRPSDELVAKQISEITAFFDPITGKFSREQYLQRLNEANLTQPEFERSLYDDLAGSHFATAAVAGMRAPRIYGAMQAAFGLETRNASWFVVDQRVAGAPPAPTDAQLQAFLSENAARFRLPEFRQVTVAFFTPRAFSATVALDEAELRRRYDFKKDSLSQAERRTFVQIPAKDAAAAQRVAQALRAGQPAEAVAKANGVEPVVFQERPRSSIPDRAVADAAFTLPAGQVSQPIRGELGFQVVQVLNVTPGRTVSFEEARPQIEEELRRDLAAEKVEQAVQAYDDARENGSNLAEAAKAAGVRTATLPPLSKDGALPNGQRLNVPPALLEAAFGLTERGESEVLEAGPGEYFAVRVEKVQPATLPTLAQLKPILAQLWTQRESARLMQVKADQLAARLRKGETLQAVAASAGAPVRSQQSIGRGAQGVSPDLMGRVFSTATGQPFTARVEGPAFVVGRVDAINTPAPAVAARPAEERRPAITMDLFSEVGDLARAAARTEVKAKNWPDRAAAALGVTPPEGSAPADKSKKK